MKYQKYADEIALEAKTSNSGILIVPFNKEKLLAFSWNVNTEGNFSGTICPCIIEYSKPKFESFSEPSIFHTDINDADVDNLFDYSVVQRGVWDCRLYLRYESSELTLEEFQYFSNSFTYACFLFKEAIKLMNPDKDYSDYDNDPKIESPREILIDELISDEKEFSDSLTHDYIDDRKIFITIERAMQRYAYQKLKASINCENVY